MLLGTVALTAIVGVTAYAGDQIVSRSDRSDRVTVIYWEKWTGSEGEEMQKVVQAFNRSQDKIFVKYLSISGIDQKTILATAGGNPPDIAGIWDGGVFQFADANALTDYPATTDREARDPRLVNNSAGFTLKLAAPVPFFAVRVVGVPSSGDNPAQNFSSCGDLQAFAK
jgi:ABC-type glycerol-3-phosphate transport system substrate-binding protein